MMDMASGLARRASATNKASTTNRATDLAAIRKLIRHLEQDPRTPTTCLVELELTLRPPLEMVTEFEAVEPLLSRLTKPPLANPTPELVETANNALWSQAVSYTHLTLPTICSV